MAPVTTGTFLGRLCALVPPPRFHMTRYYGVFASRHHLEALREVAADREAAKSTWTKLERGALDR